MKRILIVLFSVLLVFSFSSCEKDKSDEVIANYEEYWKTMKIWSNSTDVIDYEAAEGTGIVEVSLKAGDTGKVNKYSLQDSLKLIGVKGKVDSIESVSGSITGTHKGMSNWDLTYKDIVITYKLEDDETEYTFTLSGTDKSVLSEDGIQTAEINLKINGKEYKISQTANNKTNKFISATVNGKDVNMRLLNGYYYTISAT